MTNDRIGGGRRGCRSLALDGDKWKLRPKDNYERAGGNGFGIGKDEVMYTLNTTDRHIVCAEVQCPSR